MNTESKRQQRFAGVIQQDFGALFQREGGAWAPGAFITITRVRMTPVRAIARVYLRFLKTKKEKQELANIRSHASEISDKLRNSSKKQEHNDLELEYSID